MNILREARSCATLMHSTKKNVSAMSMRPITSSRWVSIYSRKTLLTLNIMQSAIMSSQLTHINFMSTASILSYCTSMASIQIILKSICMIRLLQMNFNIKIKSMDMVSTRFTSILMKKPHTYSRTEDRRLRKTLHINLSTTRPSRWEQSTGCLDIPW